MNFVPIYANKLGCNLSFWVLSHFGFFSLFYSSSHYEILVKFHLEFLSVFFFTFWVFEFCHILSFWVLSHFEFLSCVTFWVFKFCHILSFEFVTFWIFELCHILSFSVDIWKVWSLCMYVYIVYKRPAYLWRIFLLITF